MERKGKARKGNVEKGKERHGNERKGEEGRGMELNETDGKMKEGMGGKNKYGWTWEGKIYLSIRLARKKQNCQKLSENAVGSHSFCKINFFNLS